MISNVTKEKKGFSFSYLDLILLILFFLVFSLGFGLLLDSQSREDNQKSVTVTLETVLPTAMKDGVPKDGDIIFDENGEEVGTVLSGTVSEDATGVRVLLRCRLTHAVQGEEMTVETLSFIRTMKIVSVEENKGESQ